jgi:transcriptional regulator with XRE-family HTH domain
MAEDERKEFGAYMARLREAAGLSLREAGAKAGLSNTYLHQIEKGDRNPPRTEKLEILADVYGVSREAMLAAAGRGGERQKRQYYDALDNAFEFVTRHPKFKFGTQLSGETLTPAAKRYIIELFEEATGLKVLTEMEKKELAKE